MRYIVYGAGAVGCSIGAHLFLGGHAVVLVGRDAHVNKINQDGLHFVTADDEHSLRIPAVTSAEALTPFTDDDVILLTVKSQHTFTCLGQLKSAGASKNLPIVCCQNSIWNEPTCARVFHRVYGMVTVLPSVYLEAGEILNLMTERYGFLEVGCFPGGLDPLAEQIVSDLDQAGFVAHTHSDVMTVKRAKCLGNLSNVVRALVADENRDSELINLLRSEAQNVWRACGFDWEDHAEFRARIKAAPGTRTVPVGYEHMKFLGSSWQSLQRGAGSIETEFLNGEVVRLGELVGVDAPYNRLATRLAAEMVANHTPPGRYAEADILAMV